VLGKLDDFGDLMGVSRRTAWSDLEYLCSINLLAKMPDYKVGRSYGRDGEAIEHRQLPNWYAPGPELRTIWRAFEAEQAQKAAKWEERFPSSVPSVPTVHKSTTAAKWSDSSSTPDTGEGARRCGTWRANMGLEAGTPNEPPKSPRAGESDFQRQIRESRERGSTECKIYDPSLRSKKAKLRSTTTARPEIHAPRPSVVTQTGFAGPASKGKTPTPAAPKNVAARPISADDERVLAAAESAGVEPEVLRGLYRLFPDVAVSLARNHPKKRIYAGLGARLQGSPRVLSTVGASSA
jgi:hypothetical protein